MNLVRRVFFNGFKFRIQRRHIFRTFRFPSFERGRRRPSRLIRRLFSLLFFRQRPFSAFRPFFRLQRILSNPKLAKSTHFHYPSSWLRRRRCTRAFWLRLETLILLQTRKLTSFTFFFFVSGILTTNSDRGNQRKTV